MDMQIVNEIKEPEQLAHLSATYSDALKTSNICRTPPRVVRTFVTGLVRTLPPPSAISVCAIRAWRSRGPTGVTFVPPPHVKAGVHAPHTHAYISARPPQPSGIGDAWPPRKVGARRHRRESRTVGPARVWRQPVVQRRGRPRANPRPGAESV